MPNQIFGGGIRSNKRQVKASKLSIVSRPDSTCKTPEEVSVSPKCVMLVSFFWINHTQVAKQSRPQSSHHSNAHGLKDSRFCLVNFLLCSVSLESTLVVQAKSHFQPYCGQLPHWVLVHIRGVDAHWNIESTDTAPRCSNVPWLISKAFVCESIAVCHIKLQHNTTNLES